MYITSLDALYWIVTSRYSGILLYQACCGCSCRCGWWANHSCPVDVYYMSFVLCMVSTLFLGYCMGLCIEQVNVGYSLESRHVVGNCKSWLKWVTTDCALCWWLLGKVEAGPNWFFIVSFVAGHYTCPCLVYLLIIELPVLQTIILLLSCKEFYQLFFGHYWNGK